MPACCGFKTTELVMWPNCEERIIRVSKAAYSHQQAFALLKEYGTIILKRLHEATNKCWHKSAAGRVEKRLFAHFMIKNIDENFTHCVEKKGGDISFFDEFLLVCIL